MKVAHIAFQYGLNNTGGAAIAATRLHHALLAHGVESHYICLHQRESGANVHVLPRGWRRFVFLMLTKISRCVWKFTSYRKSICLNIVPLFGLDAELKKINPDVVHVQWLNADVCSFEQLARLSYKIVFNLHDLFVINAIAPCPCQDRRFVSGFDRLTSTRLERWLFNRKRKMVATLKPSFIGPSEWVCQECRASLIGKGCDVHAIPNLPDPIFERANRTFADASVAHSRFVILYGAFGGRGNSLKGFEDLVKALENLTPEVKREVELHIFGEFAAPCEIAGIQTHFLGPVTSPEDLLVIYQSAALFAFPSRQETQGMTKVEALLCGLPVVAFDRTACAEGIEHGKTGWIAADDDIRRYTAGLEWAFDLWKSGEMDRRRINIASVTRRIFDNKIILDRIASLYSKVAHG